MMARSPERRDTPSADPKENGWQNKRRFGSFWPP
jgi:hypothetical protein